jgi:hypothetical protein
MDQCVLPAWQGGKTMNWLFEEEERVRVKGFSIFDHDFDLMLGDLCRDAREETKRDMIRESLAKNRKVCLDPVAKLFTV